MIKPKDGEWWMCTVSANEYSATDKPLMKTGDRWAISDGCYQSGCFTIHPLYKMVKAEEPKPRTKVEYEEALLTKMSDIFVVLESGEWLYTSKDGSTHIDLYLALTWKPSALRDKQFYRKVEKEIDWREAAIKMGGASKAKHMPNELKIDGVYNQEEALELANAILGLTDWPE